MTNLDYHLPQDVKEEVKLDAMQFLKESFPSSERDPNARMVAVDYKIVSTALSHTYDLRCFRKKVVGVAKEWDKWKNHEKYIAPYFCFVQSSGMGKTKIMYEFAKTVNDDHDSEISCDLVLPTKKLLASVNGDEVFAEVLDFPNMSAGGTTATAASARVRNYLNNTFLESESALRLKQERKRIHVILFDEAQVLLGKHFNQQAFLLRCIRIWLRAKNLTSTVVAVFAGTTSALSNYNVTDDSILETVSSSREDIGDGYYEKGMVSFPPFVCTTTIGVLHGDATHDVEDEEEYYQSIRYGRPLFATMHKHNHLESSISIVLRRMLLMKDDSWDENALSWLSILATRVQMGSTSVSITSELVAKSYANLISVPEHDTATFAYLADPVCARLAMCMMDGEWKFKSKSDSFTMSGKPKTWWVEKVKFLYSSGLCRPEKGDFGEVMVALYFLFCGDECRRGCLKDNKDYKKFSIQLHIWIASLLQHPSEPQQKTPKISPSANHVEISFIQVCGNPLRHYRKSWKDFADEKFLSYMYASGTAFYMYPGCPLIDLGAPMRFTKEGKVSYGALLISVKSWDYFRPGLASTICSEMTTKAEENNCTSTLCLLVVFGQEKVSNDKEYTWTNEKLDNLIEGHNVSAVLRLPFEDRFNLTSTFISLTTSIDEPLLVEANNFIRGLSVERKEDAFRHKPEEILRDLKEFE
jgi:hypothetical protein